MTFGHVFFFFSHRQFGLSWAERLQYKLRWNWSNACVTQAHPTIWLWTRDASAWPAHHTKNARSAMFEQLILHSNYLTPHKLVLLVILTKFCNYEYTGIAVHKVICYLIDSIQVWSWPPYIGRAIGLSLFDLTAPFVPYISISMTTKSLR
jgi:hypothetical protein